MDFPTLMTERLLLDRPTEKDLDTIVRHLAADSIFSENTLNIPFPYERHHAEYWLAEIVEKGFEAEKSFVFAIRRNGSAEMIGAIGIHLRLHKNAEIGYWLAKENWNKGYVSEAAKSVIKFGFEALNLHKIYATHHPQNPASGKVMKNAGMQYEATLKEEICKGGKYIDLIRYCILRHQFEN